MLVVHTSEKYTDSVLNAAGLEDCNACRQDDSSARYVQEATQDCQSTIQWLCKRLQNVTDKAGRLIVKLETFLPVDGLPKMIQTGRVTIQIDLVMVVVQLLLVNARCILIHVFCIPMCYLLVKRRLWKQLKC